MKPSFSSPFEGTKRWLMRFPAMAHISRLSRLGRMHFLARNRSGALIRLIFTGVCLAVYWFSIVVAKGFPGELPAEWQNEMGPIVFLLLNMLAPFFQPEVLVFMLPVIGFAFLGLFIGARYLGDLFELDSIWTAFHYLFGSILGINYPHLVIDQGNLETLEAENSENPLITIGGPGLVDVYLGFAAVFESENGHPKVLSARQQSTDAIPEWLTQSDRFIEGFTRLRDVIDLRDRHSKSDDVLAITRDGIEVYARDVQALFRVHSGDQERTLENPYPFDERGIRRLVYGQPVSKKGTSRWENILPSIIKREIREFVSQRKVEDFLATQPFRMLEDEDITPRDESATKDESEGLTPRRDLTERFHTEERKARLKDQGLEATWVGVGAWELRDENIPLTSGEIGPSKTLLTAWRDFQLARRLSTQRYLDRKQYDAYQNTISETITSLVRAWKEHKLRRVDRCYELLSTYRQRLLEIRTRLERDTAREGRIQAILHHLDSLIGPTVLGGPEF